MMKIPVSIDKYLIIAHEKGYLKINGPFLSLTETGIAEMNTITDHCLVLIKDAVGDDIDVMAEKLSSIVKEKITPRTAFQITLAELTGTEARLLAFLLHEKDTDFKALTSAAQDMIGAGTSDTDNVKTLGKKKPKYDA